LIINYCSAPRSLALYYVVTTMQGQLCETRLHNRYVRFRRISSISMYMEFPRTMAHRQYALLKVKEFREKCIKHIITVDIIKLKLVVF